MSATDTRLPGQPSAQVFTIAELLRKVRDEELLVPLFQRPLRWTDEDVRLLLDSIQRGYPVGALLFWKWSGPGAAVQPAGGQTAHQPGARARARVGLERGMTLDNCVRMHSYADMTDEARELREALRTLVAAYGVLDENERPCGAPLPLPQAHALLTLLAAEAPLTVAELAATLSIDRTNVSRLAIRMENGGELERLPNPKDGRSRLLRLTPHGRSVARAVDRSSLRHFSVVAEALPAPASEVVDALMHLSRALRAARSKTEDPRP